MALALGSGDVADDGISPSVEAPSGAYAALIGLLDMPIVYGEPGTPSGDTNPKSRAARIDVRAQPSRAARVVATIDTRGVAADGAHRCRWRGVAAGAIICPHWESGYEIPALAVFETRPGAWYRIAIERGATRFGWIRSDEPFHALEALVASDDHLTYLTARWPRTLHDRAGGGTTTHVEKRPPPPGQSGDTTPYRALRHARIGAELWIEVEVLDQVCGANDPRVIGTGWIPARTPGALLVWYHSRGC